MFRVTEEKVTPVWSVSKWFARLATIRMEKIAQRAKPVNTVLPMTARAKIAQSESTLRPQAALRALPVHPVNTRATQAKTDA